MHLAVSPSPYLVLQVGHDVRSSGSAFFHQVVVTKPVSLILPARSKKKKAKKLGANHHFP
jgi:hypothetical protein